MGDATLSALFSLTILALLIILALMYHDIFTCCPSSPGT